MASAENVEESNRKTIRAERMRAQRKTTFMTVGLNQAKLKMPVASRADFVKAM